MDLHRKRAIVVGGSSGIGQAAAEQLAAGGASVTVISRDPGRAHLTEGIEIRACDVLDEAALSSLFAELAPFEILVSAATGGPRAVGPFLEMEMEGFRGSFAKVWGYANVVRYGAPHLSEDGAIVLVSGAPARRIKPGQIAIGAAGAAVESMVTSLAAELAPRRINVVSPGTISTPMFGPDTPERQAALEGATTENLIPRPGHADEVAQAMLFCITNDFVTGTTVDVDGGWLLS